MTVTKEISEHKMRRIIFNYISTNPGSSFGSIKNLLDMNKSTLKYHLNYLERNKRILSKKNGRKRIYYAVEGPSHNILSDMNHGQLNKKQQRIFNEITKTPGISQKLLKKRLKYKQNTVSYNIKRLIELGLIWKVKNNGKIGYEPATPENLRDAIMDRLMIRLYRNEIDKETFLKLRKRVLSLDEE